ncbi:hypothetical protein MPH_11273 [Macrophomina phaseolina MS6]|uniref:Uncharacterized protein n=1 Tax=Macrophomina phaseolina (strain MS6) TaxID=1126212 RepID=K2RB53_MACPH|nr:hypothetical protein MPH_11273 [Macrophomina phaseolina MS6]
MYPRHQRRRPRRKLPPGSKDSSSVRRKQNSRESLSVEISRVSKGECVRREALFEHYHTYTSFVLHCGQRRWLRTPNLLRNINKTCATPDESKAVDAVVIFLSGSRIPRGTCVPTLVSRVKVRLIFRGDYDPPFFVTLSTQRKIPGGHHLQGAVHCRYT